MMRISYQIHEECTARDYLLSYHLSKSKVYILFQSKAVLRNDEVIHENTILHIGDCITILQPGEIDYVIEDGELDILYEDDYFLILNKPNGMIIHTDDKSKKGSLCNLVAGYYKKMGYDCNILFAHRLDTETTGVIVFCKDILSHAYMNHFISTHEIRREYRALVQGTMKKKTDRVVLPMGRDRHNSKRMRVSKDGMEAITNYEVLYTYKSYSLLRIVLETGRTHQIRCHMSYLGNPLLGDTLYGGQKGKIDRVALHSYRISFIHPVTKNPLEVFVDVPKDMKDLLR